MINYDNLCANFTWVSPLTKTGCSQIDDAIIEKGLRIAIVSYAEDTRKLLTEYWATDRKKIDTKLLTKKDYLTLESI
jgi:hypothetical protein